TETLWESQIDSVKYHPALGGDCGRTARLQSRDALLEKPRLPGGSWQDWGRDQSDPDGPSQAGAYLGDRMKLIAGNSNRPLAEAIASYLGTPLTKASIR